MRRSEARAALEAMADATDRLLIGVRRYNPLGQALRNIYQPVIEEGVPPAFQQQLDKLQ